MQVKQHRPNDKVESKGSDLLTVTEAAGFLRLQVSTIRAWVLHRQLPFVKLGGKRVFFRRTDLEEFVAASVVPAIKTPA